MSKGLKLVVLVVAIFGVLAFSETGGAKSFGDRGTLSLSSAKVQVGHVVGFNCEYTTLANGSTVHFYVGSSTPNGVTQVTVNGVTLTIPVANAVDAGGAVAMSNVAHLDYTVPKATGIVGTEMRVIAVVVTNGVAIVSNFATSGPILGDDIS